MRSRFVKDAEEFEKKPAFDRFKRVMRSKVSATLPDDDGAAFRVLEVTAQDLRPALSSTTDAKPSDDVPPIEFLQAARQMLLSEHGPCVAAQPDLLLATAQELCRRDS